MAPIGNNHPSKGTHFFNVPQVKAKHLQKALLIVTVACAILSLIPPLRFAGAVALRGTALVASGVNFLDAWKIEGAFGRLINISKIALVALGLVGLVLSSPLLIVGSLTADCIMQIIEMGKALYRDDFLQAGNHFASAFVDAFFLIALLTGSWEVAVTAACLSMALMFALCIETAVFSGVNKTTEHLVEIFCLLALAGVGMANAITTSEIMGWKPKKPHFQLTNDTKNTMVAYDKKGNTIAVLAPGESKDFDFESGIENLFETPTGSFVKRGLHIVYYNNDKKVGGYYHYEWIADHVVTQPPLPAHKFPTLPLGRTALATGNLRKALSIKPKKHPIILQ